MLTPEEADKQQRKVASTGIPVAQRHIFLCCDQTTPKCCEKERGLAAWDYLKVRLKELGLSESGGILRTKANCLRICAGGPVALVYPEGISVPRVRSAGARADHPGTSHPRPPGGRPRHRRTPAFAGGGGGGGGRSAVSGPPVPVRFSRSSYSPILLCAARICAV